MAADIPMSDSVMAEAPVAPASISASSNVALASSSAIFVDSAPRSWAWKALPAIVGSLSWTYAPGTIKSE